MLQDYTKQLEKIDRVCGLFVAVLHRRLTIRQQRLAREMHAWELLHHPNITPLLGFKRSKNNIILGDSPFLVAPYYARGNLLMYLAKTPDANRFTLASLYNKSAKPADIFPLKLHQAACGLNYLHTLTPHPVCHLDVKGVCNK
jgi:serine/threonine protein kinase